MLSGRNPCASLARRLERRRRFRLRSLASSLCCGTFLRYRAPDSFGLRILGALKFIPNVSPNELHANDPRNVDCDPLSSFEPERARQRVTEDFVKWRFLKVL